MTSDRRIDFLDENLHLHLQFLLSAGVDHQGAEVVCAAINTFGSSNSSLLLAVQTEKELMGEKVNDNVVGMRGAVGTRDFGHPGNSRQPTAGMEKLVGDKENIQLSEEEIFWIPFQPNSNEWSNRAEDHDLKKVRGEGDAFEKAEQADKVKNMYQGENLARHETTIEFFDNEENSVKKENSGIMFAKLNSSFAHARTPNLSLLVKSFMFMQGILYFSF